MTRSRMLLVVAVVGGLWSNALDAQTNPRARDLGVPFEGAPAPLNAITDVAGVEVGHVTLIVGEGTLVVGQGPIRTGVTAVLPRGKASSDPVFGGWFTLNGAGEMTGTTWLEERGFLEGPVLITNTHSVGIVRDAAIEWMLRHGWQFAWTTPVVAETYDGGLNDINGFHVKKEHVFQALDSAATGRVAEGNVGGGTGMICHQFKGGIGTSSRRLPQSQGGYTIGVLVQCNYGSRAQLRVSGVPVGQEITDLLPSRRAAGQRELADRAGDGSIIIVIATDAPLLPHQLKRVAKRASLGIGRMGGTASNGSGDIFVAFSTANPGAEGKAQPVRIEMLGNDQLSPVFEATAQATEEAITNALVAARTLSGANGFTVNGLPHERLREVMKKYNRVSLAPIADAQAPGDTPVAKPTLPNPYRLVPDWPTLPATMKGPNGRKWGEVIRVHVAPNGNIWVFHRCFNDQPNGDATCVNRGDANPPILEFDPAGKLLKSFGVGLFAHPHGFTVDQDGNIWATDTNDEETILGMSAKNAQGVTMGQQILKISPTGKVLMTIGTPGVSGNGPNTFDQPTGVSIAPNGNIFVSDGHSGNKSKRARVVKYSPDGKFIKTWGRMGPEEGNFRDPHDLYVGGSKGYVYVADRQNSRIQVFDQEGNLIAAWKQFGQPSSVYVDKNDNIYVGATYQDPSRGSVNRPTTEPNNRAIVVGNAITGELKYLIPDPGDLSKMPDTGTSASGIAVDDLGNIYAADVGFNNLRKYTKVQ